MRSASSIVCAAASLLLPPVALATNPVFDRPLDFVYALTGGPAMNYTDRELLSDFDAVKPRITALVPFFLNVADPDNATYSNMLAEVKKRGITIVPAVGKPAEDGQLDQKHFRDIAAAYKPYSDYIRLEGTKGYYENATTRDSIQRMIDYCVQQKFKHIMLNPWPLTSDGKAVPFKNAELDSTIFQVLLDKDDATHEPIYQPTNWYPHTKLIDAVRAIQPSMDILINYEAAPQQDVLTHLERQKKGASETAMQTTIQQINQNFKGENLHWLPPFDQSYDPIKLGTWEWIVTRLSNMPLGSSN